MITDAVEAELLASASSFARDWGPVIAAATALFIALFISPLTNWTLMRLARDKDIARDVGAVAGRVRTLLRRSKLQPLIGIGEEGARNAMSDFWERWDSVSDGLHGLIAEHGEESRIGEAATNVIETVETHLNNAHWYAVFRAADAMDAAQWADADEKYAAAGEAATVLEHAGRNAPARAK